MVTLHDGSVTGFYGREILVLYIHVLTQLAVRCSSKKAVKDMLHLGITTICILVDFQYLTVIHVLVCLVEHTQYLNKAVVYTTMKKRYLNDNAVMHKTLNERVGHTLGNLNTVVVV